MLADAASWLRSYCAFKCSSNCIHVTAVSYCTENLKITCPILYLCMPCLFLAHFACLCANYVMAFRRLSWDPWKSWLAFIWEKQVRTGNVTSTVICAICITAKVDSRSSVHSGREMPTPVFLVWSVSFVCMASREVSHGTGVWPGLFVAMILVHK